MEIGIGMRVKQVVDYQVTLAIRCPFCRRDGSCRDKELRAKRNELILAGNARDSPLIKDIDKMIDDLWASRGGRQKHYHHTNRRKRK